MANNPMIPKTPKQELLDWLALKPRTQGWGAVVAYERKKCNSLLLQEYINKFTLDSYLPPISKPVPTGEANWEYLHDWVTDKPRLSFENSSTTAGGEVNMRMAVVGGSQISIDNVPGHKRAIAVKSLDALDYPELVAENVALTKTSGTVGKDTGEVILDLGDPETAKGIWELSFANTQHERRLGGEFFKRYFKEADKGKRLYHLGKIALSDQQHMQPKSFKLRTITAPGAQLRSSENFGDGAIELFVCMEGETEGGMPGEDWKYLIPDEPGGGDCTVLLGSSLLLKYLYLDELKSLAEYGTPNFVEVLGEKGFPYLRASSDVAGFYIPVSNVRTSRGHLIDFNQPIKVNFESQSGRAPLTLGLKSDGLVWLEVGSDSDSFTEYDAVLDGEHNAKFGVRLAIYSAYKYVLDSEIGDVSLELVEASVEDRATISRLHIPNPPYGFDDWTEMASAIFKTQDEVWPARIKGIELMPQKINPFVLHSILFNESDVVRSHSIATPGDLVLFSQINPKLTAFSISPLEHLMGHGATHQFEVSKDFTSKVEWGVVPIPGSTGGIGSIDKDTGLYRAPDLGDISGTFARVRVTATDPVSKYSSSALITVVVRDITINPVVQICNASTSDTPVTRTLSANTLGEGVLEWKVTQGEGTISPGPDGKHVFTAGLKNEDLEGSFEVVTIEVKNLATGKTQHAYVLVGHFPLDLTMVIDMEQSSFPQGKAKLKAMPPRGTTPVDADFKVVAGNGSVDGSGMYTSDPASPHRFALVKATDKADSYRDCWIILTYPLIELPDKPIDNLAEY